MLPPRPPPPLDDTSLRVLCHFFLKDSRHSGQHPTQASTHRQTNCSILQSAVNGGWRRGYQFVRPEAYLIGAVGGRSSCFDFHLVGENIGAIVGGGEEPNASIFLHVLTDRRHIGYILQQHSRQNWRMPAPPPSAVSCSPFGCLRVVFVSFCTPSNKRCSRHVWVAFTGIIMVSLGVDWDTWKHRRWKPCFDAELYVERTLQVSKTRRQNRRRNQCSPFCW